MRDLLSDENEILTCAFTGHRELGGDFDAQILENLIEKLIKEGVGVFYDGGARGFDLIAAESVLKLKQKYPVTLVICVPCYGQEKMYSEQDKARYSAVLKGADEVVYVSENYYKGCFLRRNDYMIERADYLIAYLKEDEGGTAYTVKKFRAKKGENIYFI